MKKTMIWLLVLSLLLGLTGCGAGTPEPSVSDTPSATDTAPSTEPAPTEPPVTTETVTTEPVITEPAAPSAPVPVTLKVMGYAADQQSGWLGQQLDAFQAAHPEYLITWDLSVRDRWENMAEVLRDDPDPDADIYFIRSSDFSLVMGEDLIRPIGEDAQRLLQDQAPQAAWDSVRFKGGYTYGLPLSCELTVALVYRKSVFSDQDIGALETMLEKSTVCFPSGIAYYGSMAFYAAGGSIDGSGIYDPKCGIRFGGPEGQEVGRKLSSLAADPDLRPHASWEDFLSGAVDAYIDSAFLYQEARQTLGDDVGIAPMPTITLSGSPKPLKNRLDFHMVCVGDREEHGELAEQLAAQLTSPEAQAARYQMTGAAPIARCLMQSPEVMADPLASTLMTQAFHNSVPYREIDSAFWGHMNGLLTTILSERPNDKRAAELVDRYFPTPMFPSQTQEPVLPPTEGKQRVVMRVWSGNTEWAQQVLDQFEDMHPEYSFYWLLEDTDTYMVTGRLSTEIDMDPSVDVMVYQRSDLDELLELEALAPIRQSAPAGIPQILMDSVTGADGQIYGLPISSSPELLFYNKDIYTPEDLGSLEALLEKGRVCYTLSGAESSLALFLANGCTLYGPKSNDPSAGIQLGGDRGYEVVSRLVELLNDPMLGDRHLSRNRMDTKDMISGEVAAWIGGDVIYRELLAGMGAEKLGVAPLPTVRIGGRDVPIPTVIDPTCVGVGADSRYPELAQELAALLASGENQLLRYQLHGHVPTDMTLMAEPSIFADHRKAISMEMAASQSCYYPSIPNTPNNYFELSRFLIDIIHGKVTKENYKECFDQFLQRFG